MVNRKKRLKKGIDSIQSQIDFHLEKQRTAKEKGEMELSDYYEREILGLQKAKNKKERILK